MDNARHSHSTGQQLVVDYQTIFLSRAMSEYAETEAAVSESDLMNQLVAIQSGGYLNPASFDDEIGARVAKVSLDAHVKKVQAAQLKTLSTTQRSELMVVNNKLFVGKKVRIRNTGSDFNPFDFLWFDSTHGYRTNAVKKQYIEGIIKELLVDKNILVLQPKLLRRIVNSNLQNYLVYVINPRTLEPAVSVEVI